MYGFSGYGTNTYGSKRQTVYFRPLAPVVKLATLIVRNTYNVGMTLMLKFKNLTIGL